MSFAAYSSVPKPHKKSLWLLDTGASQHMCNDITCFRTFKKWTAQVDFGGENTDRKVHGSGDVLLRLRSQNNDPPTHLRLRNVLYIPKLRKNLICSYSLGEHGIDVAIRKNHFSLLKDGKCIGSCFVHNRLMYLHCGQRDQFRDQFKLLMSVPM
ncbi:hypothetical protein V1505DRAFT_404769, partial [Lipomyces doorenjongii]